MLGQIVEQFVETLGAFCKNIIYISQSLKLHVSHFSSCVKSNKFRAASELAEVEVSSRPSTAIKFASHAIFAKYDAIKLKINLRGNTLCGSSSKFLIKEFSVIYTALAVGW